MISFQFVCTTFVMYSCNEQLVCNYCCFDYYTNYCIAVLCSVL